MLTHEEYLLTKIAEEAMELAQRCTKALCFGLEEVQPEQTLTNRQRILQEANDLFGTMQMADLYEPDQEAMDAKKEKVRKYMRYSQDLGTLEKCGSFWHYADKDDMQRQCDHLNKQRMSGGGIREDVDPYRVVVCACERAYTLIRASDTWTPGESVKWPLPESEDDDE